MLGKIRCKLRGVHIPKVGVMTDLICKNCGKDLSPDYTIIKHIRTRRPRAGTTKAVREYLGTHKGDSFTIRTLKKELNYNEKQIATVLTNMQRNKEIKVIKHDHRRFEYGVE